MDYAIEGPYRTGRYSGLITGVVAGDGTNGHLWVCRWAVPSATTALVDRRRVAVIQRLRVRAFTVAGYTAAQEVLLAVYKLTGYSAAHAGGTALTPDKKFVAAPTPGGAAAPLMTGRMAAAAQLTAGTHVIGTDSIAAASCAELAAAATVQKGAIDILVSTEDLIQHPIELTDQEGLLVRNEVAQGAGGTMRLVVEMDWHELQRYPVGTYGPGKGVV